MSKFFEHHQQLLKKARQAHVLKWGVRHKAATAFPSGMWVAQTEDPDYPLLIRYNCDGSLDPQDSPGIALNPDSAFKRAKENSSKVAE